MGKNKLNEDNVRELIRHFQLKAFEYEKRLVTSLALASGAGLAALISFTSNYDDPEHYLKNVVISLWLFTLSLLTAGILPFVYSRMNEFKGHHFSSPHNRDQFEEHASTVLEIISSSKKQADEFNKPKNRLKERAKYFHNIAEESWSSYIKWRRISNVLLLLSGASFFVGLLWPIYRITFIGSLG